MTHKGTLFSFLALSLLLLASCADPHRMGADDLRYYKINCAQKNEQLAFLETQLVSNDERTLTAMSISGWGGAIMSSLDGSYENKRAISNREHEAIIKRLMWELRTTC